MRNATLNKNWYLSTILFIVSFNTYSQNAPYINLGANFNSYTDSCITLNSDLELLYNTSAYNVNDTIYYYSTMTGTPVLVGNDDIWSNTVNIGFDFCFFNQKFDKLLIGANGQITFDVSKANGWNEWEISSGLPISNSYDLPGNTICASFRDIDIRFGGVISYMITGVEPNRKFNISWDNVPLYSSGGNVCTTDAKSTFRCVLYETTNRIEIIVKNSTSCSGWNDGYGIIGIQNATGTIAYCPPNRNYPNQWTAIKESWLFTPSANADYTVSWYDSSSNLIGSTDSIEVCPHETNTYYATLTNSNCDSTFVISDSVKVTVEDYPLGLSEKQLVVELSPNPVKDNLFLKLYAVMNVRIIDTFNREYFTGKNRNAEPIKISVSDWPSQVYFVQVSNEVGIQNIKFIKQ